jgi:flagellar protein FliL
VATNAKVAEVRSVSAAPVLPPPPKSKTGLIIALIIGLVAIGAAGAWFVMRATQTHPDTKKPTEFVNVDPWLTVNLREDSEGRYLQVGVMFEISAKGAKTQLNERLPAIRSKIILLGSSKSGKELKTPEGKRAFADEILELAREQLDGQAGSPPGPTFGVESVHFSVFVIQ